MNIIAFLILGLIAGWIANMILSSGRGGFFADLLLGVVGAFVGGFIGVWLFNADVTGINIQSILLSVLGAVVVVAIYRALTGQAIRQ